MSQFTGVLRKITKKASHPNSLLYNIQLERAKQRYLVRGELEDESDNAVALGAPKDEFKDEAAGQEKDASGTEQREVPEVTEHRGEGSRTGSVVTAKSGQQETVDRNDEEPQNDEIGQKSGYSDA